MMGEIRAAAMSDDERPPEMTPWGDRDEPARRSTTAGPSSPQSKSFMTEFWKKYWVEKSNPGEHFYWLGAPFPWRRAQPDLYVKCLEKRFRLDATEPPKISKDGLDYVGRAYDRLINEARGLLTFYGLLFTSFGFIAQRLQARDKTSLLALAAALLPLAGSFLLLLLFRMD
jgi:hypothetical protein